MGKSSIRLVFLYAGKYNSTDSYTIFTESNINSLSNASAFVICCTDKYAVYSMGPYTELINAIASQAAILKSKSKQFYVGIPCISAPAGYSATDRTRDYGLLKPYILAVKTKLTQNNTWASCAGFYWTNERVFDTVNASSPMSNQHVQLMNDIAYVIRNDPNSGINKDFIWSPYLGFNSDYYNITNNLGIVANKTSIFNTIFLQSQYYFTPESGAWNQSTRTGVPAANLELAYKSALDNKVYNYASATTPSGEVVVGSSKTGNTMIGANIECDNYLNSQNPLYAPYYIAQAAKYKPLLMTSGKPFIAYGGSHDGIIGFQLYKPVDKFYQDGTYRSPLA